MSWAPGVLTLGALLGLRMNGRVLMYRRVVGLVIAGLFLASCSSNPSGTPPPSAAATTSPTAPGSSPSVPAQPTPGEDGIVLLAANVPRAAASVSEAAEAAHSINAFGITLYRRLASADQNLVISPASIALALGMARAGANGTTAAEMDAVLSGLAAPENAGALNALDQALATRTAAYPDIGGEMRQVTLRIANAPFAQRDMPIEQGYLDALASLYGAGLRLVDYIGDTEGARRLINGWVDGQTEHRIPELLAQGVLSPQSRLTLVNAIYLKAPWKEPFIPQLTEPAAFTLGSGAAVSVPFMHGRVASASYAKGPGWEMVEIPYLGDTMAMTVVLPDDLAAFSRELDPAWFTAAVAQLQPKLVELSMPKFGIETAKNLRDVLMAMGMPTAFTDRADFSGITTAETLAIDAVIHQANIDVDEKGTTAAAATAVAMGATGGEPPEAVSVTLDHPFLFALRDLQTGAVLFLGQVADPSKVSGPGADT